MDNEAVVNGRYVGFVVAYVDYDTTEGVCCIQLAHGTFQNCESSNVESFEEYLTYSLIGVSGEAW
jgi:hypothetical protein